MYGMLAHLLQKSYETHFTGAADELATQSANH